MTQQLTDFAHIPDEFLWKGAALAQLEHFETLGSMLGLKPLVVGSHTSKSIMLPVKSICR